MSLRHRVIAFASVASAVAGILVACTDLDGLVGTNDDASSPEASTDAGATDGASGDSARSDASLDAASIDATARDDATAKVDASACVTCDCDTDTFSQLDAGCALDGSVADCDDTDPLIHPGQTFVDEAWSSTHLPAGDWNCDQVTTKAYPYGVACTGFSCASPEGFTGNPGCGEIGAYVTCKVAALNCVVDSTVMKKQACK